MFDIDVPPVDDIPVGKVPDKALKRRGPMAAAISETAGKAQERAEAEQAIREENDRLAFELVRLRREGLVVDRIPLDHIHADKLIRDRAEGKDPELEELKQSIQDVGLSNPIRVEPREDGQYELVQGMRRLSAYRALFKDTGDEAYATIPAGILEPGAPVEDSYRRMVDENLIRKDISFAEMGRLAQLYVEDPSNDCDDVDKAVKLLFKSASYSKRSYIRAFAGLLQILGDDIRHPNAIPRNTGVLLKRILENHPERLNDVHAALRDLKDPSPAEEVAALKRIVGQIADPPETLPMGKVSEGKTQARKPRTTFEVGQGTRLARCAASAGRLELRCDVDFSTVDRRQLESAVKAFLAAIEGDGST
jgi:ParB family chromosome partitioning protein